MKEYVFECEVITPMFMAGANTNAVELRPSEFKGMMRFWWRAIKAMDSITELKKQESEQFGGAGQNQGKSKIRIRLQYDRTYLNKFIGRSISDDYNLRWRYDKEERRLVGNDAGLGYLLYSVAALSKKREYIKDGFCFSVSLTGNDDHVLTVGVYSLWLSVYLGGFGTRARRGAGNLVIKSVDKKVSLNYKPEASDKESLKGWYEYNLCAIKEMITPNRTKKYSNLSGARMLIFDGQKSWKDALNSIGEKFANYRFRKRRDIFGTAAFGMPVRHSSNVKMVPYRNNRRLSDRWASPLIFKVIRSKGLYYPAVLKLSSEMDSGIMVGKESNRKRALKEDIKPVDASGINDFLNFLKENGKDVVEVLI